MGVWLKVQSQKFGADAVLNSRFIGCTRVKLKRSVAALERT